MRAPSGRLPRGNNRGGKLRLGRIASDLKRLVGGAFAGKYNKTSKNQKDFSDIKGKGTSRRKGLPPPVSRNPDWGLGVLTGGTGTAKFHKRRIRSPDC